MPQVSALLKQALILILLPTEWIWSQEEPVNKGPWSFIQPRFDQQLNCKVIVVCVVWCGTHHYAAVYIMQLSVVSRKPSAASSVGVTKVHQEEVKKLLTDTFPS